MKAVTSATTCSAVPSRSFAVDHEAVDHEAHDPHGAETGDAADQVGSRSGRAGSPCCADESGEVGTTANTRSWSGRVSSAMPVSESSSRTLDRLAGALRCCAWAAEPNRREREHQASVPPRERRAKLKRRESSRPAGTPSTDATENGPSPRHGFARRGRNGVRDHRHDSDVAARRRRRRHARSSKLPSPSRGRPARFQAQATIATASAVVDRTGRGTANRPTPATAAAAV